MFVGIVFSYDMFNYNRCSVPLTLFCSSGAVSFSSPRKKMETALLRPQWSAETIVQMCLELGRN